jgi:hypothetical protein
MHQSVTTLSRHNTRHLKQYGKQEPFCTMPLDEYELMTSTRRFALKKQ